MKKIISLIIILFFITNSFSVFGFSLKKEYSEKQIVKTDSNVYDMIVIYPSEYSEEIQPLIDHKNNLTPSLKTIALSTEYIFSTYQGRDDAEKIKYCIKNSIEEWGINFVLLVGNRSKVPVRYVCPMPESVRKLLKILRPRSHVGEPFISDLYYADIYNSTGDYCSWDANNNDIFGESDIDFLNETSINTDLVDLYPDVYIGRLLCSNKSEVSITVNKIIFYEKNSYNQPWLKNIIICGGNEHKKINEFNLIKIFLGLYPSWEGQYIGNKIEKIMNDYYVKKLYASATRPIFRFIDNSEALTKSNIEKYFSIGAGFVLINAHGNPYVWATYAPGYFRKLLRMVPIGEDPKNMYGITDIKKLNNTEKLPIVVLNICSGADFSINSPTESPIGWEYVKHDSGGAIACFAIGHLGLVPAGYGCSEIFSGRMAINLFKSYKSGYDQTGEMLGNAVKKYLGEILIESEEEYPYFSHHALTLESWMLLGDPSLKIGGYLQNY